MFERIAPIEVQFKFSRIDCGGKIIEPRHNFKKLGLIGIDEIAIRKGYKSYLTIITSRLDGKVRIIAVLKGREKTTVKRFLKSIPFRLKRTIEGVCCDMNEGYINAIKESLKKTPIIIDRFHVA